MVEIPHEINLRARPIHRRQKALPIGMQCEASEREFAFEIGEGSGSSFEPMPAPAGVETEYAAAFVDFCQMLLNSNEFVYRN